MNIHLRYQGAYSLVVIASQYRDFEDPLRRGPTASLRGHDEGYVRFEAYGFARAVTEEGTSIGLPYSP